MSEPWLIALDLDGTVFDDSLQIHPRVVSAVQRVQAAGHLVTLATGRMYRATRPWADRLDVTAPLICYQGALIRENGRVIAHRTVPLDVTREAIRLSERERIHLNVYCDDRLYVAQRTPEAEYYQTLSQVALNEVGDLTTLLDREPTKLVFISEPEETATWLERARALWGQRAQVVQSHARFVELTNEHVSKGHALRTLAAALDVPPERTLAVGDNLNDLSLVEAAGIGVAMGNAAPAVKAAADWIVSDVHHAGAAEALERFLRHVDA